MKETGNTLSKELEKRVLASINGEDRILVEINKDHVPFLYDGYRISKEGYNIPGTNLRIHLCSMCYYDSDWGDYLPMKEEYALYSQDKTVHDGPLKIMRNLNLLFNFAA